MERKCQCVELEKKCIDLESETKKVKEEFESLKIRFKELESEKLVKEEELRKLRESEKDWKIKFEVMVRKLDEMGAIRYGELELDEKFQVGNKTKLYEDAQSSGSLYITTPGRYKDKMSYRRKLNKMLVFESDYDKLTDVVVDLSDWETEEKSIEDEGVEADKVNIRSPLPSRKRKLVITSDLDDDDDNIPISILKKLKPTNQEMLTVEENVSGRLIKQRLVGIPTTGNVEDDETEEDASESESESLDGFIVDDDETVSEESDGEADYADVISRLRRDNKPKKQKWEYEADMLADFGKDPELCMRAVCVLYRFQTEDERKTSSSYVSNGRGFNKFDAVRGTRIGKFLTDGDPEGDLKKSVEELKIFEFDAVEVCRSLADRYSKQLFQIYNNREDPFFILPPSP